MSSLVQRAQSVASNVGNQIHVTTNRVIPPKQREETLRELRRFSQRNPKLATFIAIQAALTGIPLLLFITFALSTLLISISTALLVAVTSALIYTSFAVGLALFFLIPTLFVASCAATCFFLWGLMIYLILQRFNEGEAPAKRGTKVGDKLHGLTGDRLGWLVDQQDESEIASDKISVKEDLESLKSHNVDGAADRMLRLETKDDVSGKAGWDKKWANGTQQHQLNIAEKIDGGFETSD